jgi:rhodanese-related sulfurtransferase
MSQTLTPIELRDLVATQPVTLLDVRRAADREARPASMPGATWKDPALIETWAGELPRDKPVVIFCVRGGSVSVSVQAALQDKGFDVKYVQGGLVALEEGV